MLNYNVAVGDSDAYIMAQQTCFQLRDLAKKHGLDHRGIKVYNKRQLSAHGKNTIDAQLVWLEGPEDWAHDIELILNDNVCTYNPNGQTISFYNIDNIESDDGH